MKITRWIVAIAVLGMAVGCGQTTLQQTKADANRKWQETRAKMLCGVADEHLKVGQVDKAKLKVMEALAIDSQYVPARMLLAKVYIEEGHYSGAINELNRLCLEQPTDGEVVYLLAVAKEKDGQLADALADYRRAYAMDSKNIAAITAAAEVLVAMGQPRDAQILLDSYMSQAGDDPAMHELAGRVAAMLKEYAKALKHYQQAHDLDYKNSLYVECIAKMQFVLGQHAEAIDSLKSLLDKGRKDVWIHRMLGDCYLAMKRAAEARNEYQLICDQSPNDVGAWTSLAKAALAGGDPQRVVLASQTALQIDPRNLEAMLLQGYGLILCNENEQAVRVLSVAAAEHPQVSAIQCLLGKAHAACGNDAAAAKCFKAALNLEPENQVARELLSKTEKKITG